MAGGKSDYLEGQVLNAWLGSGTPATVYMALYSAAPTDASAGTELTGNGYARVAITNNTTNFPAASGGTKQNGTTITFPAATGANWARATGWQLLDASTAGNRLYYGPLAGVSQLAVSNDITNDTFFAPSHGYANDTIVRVFTHPQNALPSPLAQDTLYYVANQATDTFKLSTAAGGGSIVNLTTLGFVEVALDQSIVVAAGGTATFAASALTITED